MTYRLGTALAMAGSLALATVGALAGATQPARAQDQLTVAMTTWTGYGLIHLADKKGFFADNGVSVNVRTMQDKSATAAAMATGRIDGWATTVDTFIFYDADRVGATQVLAVDFSEGGEGIITGSDVDSVQDLKGKSVAAQEGSSTYFFMLNVLNDHGLSLSDIEHKDMKAGDAGAAFMAGRVDAAATWDPWLSKAQSRDDARVLVDTEERPGLIVDTVAFRKTVLNERPDDVQAFIAGYFDAYDYWQANPDAANKVMAESLGIELDSFTSSLKGLTFVSRGQNKAYFGLADSETTIQDTIETGANLYTDIGIIDQKPSVSAIVDRSVLKQHFAAQ